MYMTFNREGGFHANYGSCVVQSLIELYIMSRLHTKSENMFLNLENNTTLHGYLQNSQNILNVYLGHWSTTFTLTSDNGVKI